MEFLLEIVHHHAVELQAYGAVIYLGVVVPLEEIGKIDGEGLQAAHHVHRFPEPSAGKGCHNGRLEGGLAAPVESNMHGHAVELTFDCTRLAFARSMTKPATISIVTKLNSG